MSRLAICLPEWRKETISPGRSPPETPTMASVAQMEVGMILPEDCRVSRFRRNESRPAERRAVRTSSARWTLSSTGPRTLGDTFTQFSGILGLDSARPQVFPLNRVVNFLPVYRNFDGCVDAKTHLVAADIHHGDDNVVADHDAFVALSRQNKHRPLLLLYLTLICGVTLPRPSGPRPGLLS